MCADDSLLSFVYIKTFQKFIANMIIIQVIIIILLLLHLSLLFPVEVIKNILEHSVLRLKPIVFKVALLLAIIYQVDINAAIVIRTDNSILGAAYSHVFAGRNGLNRVKEFNHLLIPYCVINLVVEIQST
jgi:hypothetical protein